MTSELVAGRELDWQIHTRVMGRQDVYYKSYSTDIGASWTVVKVVATRFPNEFMLWQENGRWGAEFQEGTTQFAETAPLAICRAALAAVAGAQS